MASSPPSDSLALPQHASFRSVKTRYVVAALQASLYLLASVGLNVSFPLWIGVVVPNGSDSYYVWFLVSGVNAVFWGTLVLLSLLFGQLSWQNLTLPHWKAFVAGCWYAQNGLYVYAADPERTPQNLQPMLCVNLPFTMLVRAVLLRRYPVGRQRLGCAIVVLGIVVCLSGNMLDSADGGDSGTATGTSALLWSLFMLSTTLGDSVTSVYSEQILDSPGVSMIYYLFWMELWHFIIVIGVFWTDIIPGFGYASGWDQCVSNFRRGFELTFSGNHISVYPKLHFEVTAPTYLGITFLSFWALQTLGRCILIRFGDGATWSALMDALATPLQVLFLSIVSVSKSGVAFSFDITGKTVVSLFGACLSLPGVLLYEHTTRELSKSRPKEALSEQCHALPDSFEVLRAVPP